MNTTFFYTLLAIFLFLSFLIGKKTKVSQKKDDYFLGGRKIGLTQLTLTFLATQLGGGVILGTLEASYTHGLYSLLYGVGLSFGLIILSLGLGAKFRRLNISTISEIFEKIYGSQNLRKISSVISVISLFLILVAICVSSEKLFISLGFQNKSLFVIFWLATTYYTVMGGYKAVVKTDVLQVGFILLCFLVLAVYLFSEGKLSLNTANSFIQTKTDFPWFSWLISPLFFVIIGQDMGQRCFSAQSEKTVSKACFYAGILLFLSTLLPCYLGMSIQKAGLIPSPEKPLLLLSLEILGNPLLSSVLALSVLMAIVSTGDSLLCAIASHMAEDFSFAGKKENKLFFSRSSTFTVSLLALVTAHFFTGIISLMVLAYELCISTLFVPIVLSLLVKRPSEKSASFSMLAGFIAFVGSKFMPFFQGIELIPILVGGAVFFLVEKIKLTKLPNQL